VTREHEELCERLTANTEKYPGFENMNTQAAAAIRSLSEQVDKLASLDRQPTGSEREVAERIVEAYIGGPIVCEHHGILASEITLALTNARVSALAEAIYPAGVEGSHRIHSSFNQTVAVTGRLASSDPNLQNIPIRTDVGREIRRAFIADPTNVLISADYSQIELRLLAHLSRDPALIQAFHDGQDIHTALAARPEDGGGS